MSKQRHDKSEWDTTQSRNETDGSVFILSDVIYFPCKGFFVLFFFWGGGSTAWAEMSATRQAGVELCEMKIDLAECVCGVCLGGGGYSVFVQEIIIHTYTPPRDKHSLDSSLIMFHLYQDAQMCTLCPFAFPEHKSYHKRRQTSSGAVNWKFFFFLFFLPRI